MPETKRKPRKRRTRTKKTSKQIGEAFEAFEFFVHGFEELSPEEKGELHHAIMRKFASNAQKSMNWLKDHAWEIGAAVVVGLLTNAVIHEVSKGMTHEPHVD